MKNIKRVSLLPITLLICTSVVFSQQTISLKKDQIVSFITSKQLEGTDTLRDKYFGKISKDAVNHGFRLEASVDILSTNPSSYTPTPVLSIYSWPNHDSLEKFEAKPTWPSDKKMRSAIWEELRICRIEIQTDQTTTLYPNKIYRIVFLWKNSDNPDDLDKYQEAMKETREKLGARYVLGPSKGIYYHSLMENTSAPDLVWIIEWPSSRAHADYLGSQAFDDNHHYFFSGVARFQAYETTVSD